MKWPPSEAGGTLGALQGHSQVLQPKADKTPQNSVTTKLNGLPHGCPTARLRAKSEPGINADQVFVCGLIPCDAGAGAPVGTAALSPKESFLSPFSGPKPSWSFFTATQMLCWCAEVQRMALSVLVGPGKEAEPCQKSQGGFSGHTSTACCLHPHPPAHKGWGPPLQKCSCTQLRHTRASHLHQVLL